MKSTIQNICSYLGDKSKSMKWPPTPASEWYYGGALQGRLRGNLWFHVIIGAFYFFWCTGPVWCFFFWAEKDVKATLNWLFSEPWFGLLWLCIATVGLPLFVWIENLGFNTWVTNAKITDGQKKRQIERFNLSSKHMESTWKAIAGLYLVGGLISFSKLGDSAPNNETHKLAEAVKNLSDAVNMSKGQPVSDQAQNTKEALNLARKALNAAIDKQLEEKTASEQQTSTNEENKDAGQAASGT
jgi:hypothetical protein